MFLSDALVLIAPAQGRILEQEQGLGRRPWRRAPLAYIRTGSRSALRRLRTPGRGGGGFSDSATRTSWSEPWPASVPSRGTTCSCGPLPSLRPPRRGSGSCWSASGRWKRALGGWPASRPGRSGVFVGRRRDVHDILPAFDLKCLPPASRPIPSPSWRPWPPGCRSWRATEVAFRRWSPTAWRGSCSAPAPPRPRGVPCVDSSATRPLRARRAPPPVRYALSGSSTS